VATSRDEAKRKRALEIGAHEVFESGERLPGQGRRGHGDGRPATWSHSIRSLRPGGTLVTSRHDLGPEPRRRRADPDLLPAAAGDRLDDGHARRARLAGAMLDATGTGRSSTAPADGEARDGFAAMAAGDVFGKIVFTR
jgi:hypothetical protein